MKHFDPNTFISDLNLNLNNQYLEAGDVNTQSDECVKVFDETVDTHVAYCYASRNEQCSKNKPWLTKGILTSTAKKYTENSELPTTQISSKNTKFTEIKLPT